MVGQTVSHYRILEKLGEGGMGVVYKAEDTRLRRTVALKFLPPTNSENRERFLREAQAAASLNHPNICTVFEIDEEHGFIGMELIDGVSVKDKIAARPLPLEEALDIAMQTCAGLAAAHEKGIVHRDIKSANLMVTAQGQVKIMDFGLAQVGDRTRITKTGSSLGTPAYMSPEQAKGDAVDRRTDIWSVGVVLYEMLAGRLPFRGDTEQAVSYGIVHSAPEPLSALRTGLPVSLDRLAAKALSKDPEERYQHAADLGVDLRRVHRDPVQLHRPTARHRNYIVPVVALVVCLVAVWWMRQPAAGPQLPLRRFTLRFPAPTSSPPDMRLIAVSPDGNRIAIIDREKRNTVWIQELNRQQPRMLEGTEGANTVFWSPDSSTIGFGSGFGDLKRVSVKGGPPILLCERPPYISGATWSPDGGSIVFASGAPSSLYLIPASGGTPTRVVSPQVLAQERKKPSTTSGSGDWVSNPNFLPSHGGSQRLLFQSAGTLFLRDMNTNVQHEIGAGQNATYSPSGHLVYRSGRDIWARPFSLQHARFEGEAFPLARMATDPSVASDGTLVYRDLVTSQLVWLDRHGARSGIVGQPADGFFYPALSPDGRRVAVEALDNESLDVWVIEVERGTRIRLSSDPSTEILPVWSPGGDQVAFGSYRAGNIDIFVRDAEAEREEKTLAAKPINERVSDWSRDGRFILYGALHPKNGMDLWYLQRSEAGQWEQHPLLETPANEKAPKFSPDGLYVAYTSDESGRDEVYVREFLPGGRKWPVSTKGGARIRWSRNGGELFYVEAGTLIVVPVKTAAGFTAGSPSRLFSHAAFSDLDDPNYDVTADGQRILVAERVGEQERMIHVVQNWFAEFRDRR